VGPSNVPRPVDFVLQGTKPQQHSWTHKHNGTHNDSKQHSEQVRQLQQQDAVCCSDERTTCGCVPLELALQQKAHSSCHSSSSGYAHLEILQSERIQAKEAHRQHHQRQHVQARRQARGEQHCGKHGRVQRSRTRESARQIVHAGVMLAFFCTYLEL